MNLDPQSVARALRGEVNGNTVRAPGPGQNNSDRSLKIKFGDEFADGFTVVDYYGGDWRDGKDYVRSQCGEPSWDDECTPRVDHVARMRARAMGAEGSMDLNLAEPQRERRAPGNAKTEEPPLGEPIATYNYTDIDGKILYRVLRYDGKRFRQEMPDGNGGWVDDDYSTQRVIYRWPDIARFPDVPVFVCEGEKDADRVASLGYCSTTVAAGDWTGIGNGMCPKYALDGRNIFILQDNDFPGRKRAYSLYMGLEGISDIKIVALPDLLPGGDVSDWLDADPARADTLLEVCRTALEPHQPPLPSRNDDRFVLAGDEGPAISSSEKRRHFYRRYNPDLQDPYCISAPIKIKVMKKGDKDPYITFRVYDEAKGVTGWQFKTPEGFENIPYFMPDKNPFSGEANQLPLYWTEGEKDTDTLAGLGLAAFSFGGGDGLPAVCEKYIEGRHVIITGDNDEGGRRQATAKAKRAMAVAASVKVIQFTNDDVKEKGDVSDWIQAGHSFDDLKVRVEATEYWKEPESANDNSDTGNNGPPPGTDVPPNARKPIRATPYNWKDPATIPQRDWLYGRLLLRKFVTATISPGGVGKSSLIAAEALAMVSGKALLEVSPQEKLRVWLWNLEDPQEETERKIQAAALHYKLGPGDIGDRLLVDSGRDQRLVIAVTERNGVAIVQPVVDELVAEIIARKIDVIVIDPFVSCHEVAENDNPAMDRVVKQWGKVADRGNCAVHLVDHTRKMGDSSEVTTESSRGGSAKTDACRVVRVVNRMSEKQATDAGVDNHRLYFRTYSDKGNLQPPADGSDWFKLESVDLGNGPMGLPGDSVGVATRWDWPDLTAGMTAADYDKVVAVIKGGKWKENIQAKNWVGNAIAEALGLNVKDADDKAKIKAALKMYLRAGTLVVVEQQDSERRQTKLFVEVPENV
jgi:AAA domain